MYLVCQYDLEFGTEGVLKCSVNSYFKLFNNAYFAANQTYESLNDQHKTSTLHYYNADTTSFQCYIIFLSSIIKKKSSIR